MRTKQPTITQPRSASPKFSPHRREELPTPVVLVVSQDSLLRWALYEALTAADVRVLTCSAEAHARDILPHVEARFSVAIIDDDAWPLTLEGPYSRRKELCLVLRAVRDFIRIRAIDAFRLTERRVPKPSALLGEQSYRPETRHAVT